MGFFDFLFKKKQPVKQIPIVEVEIHPEAASLLGEKSEAQAERQRKTQYKIRRSARYQFSVFGFHMHLFLLQLFQ